MCLICKRFCKIGSCGGAGVEGGSMTFSSDVEGSQTVSSTLSARRLLRKVVRALLLDTLTPKIFLGRVKSFFLWFTHLWTYPEPR